MVPIRWLLVLVATTFALISPGKAEDRVSFGQSRPPYIMQDGQTGISIELFKLVYARLGRQFSPIYLSNARLAHSLENGIVIAAVEVKNTNPSLFYSEEFVSYQNFVITRREDAKHITAFADLAGLTVCTWQLADEHLGPEFRAAMQHFTYREFPNQDAQVRAFLGGRCDAVIIDRKIFDHWSGVMSRDNSFKPHIVSMDFDYDPVPGQQSNPFYVGFRDKSLRDQFDIELKAIKDDGKYREILNQTEW